MEPEKLSAFKSAPSFLSLPTEIRLTVYKFYFSGQPRTITYPFIRPFNFIEDRHWPLLLVSKAVYRDALPQYYRTCLFGTYELSNLHSKKLLENMAGSYFTQYATALLLWRIPEPTIFEAMGAVRWAKLIGITCEVQPDPVNGQIYTHDSLMAALSRARVPDFSWTRCRDLCERYPNVNFMVNFRCDHWEAKLDADGHPQRRLVKTNFVYDVRADTFVEETQQARKPDGLILRAQGASRINDDPTALYRAFRPI